MSLVGLVRMPWASGAAALRAAHIADRGRAAHDARGRIATGHDAPAAERIATGHDVVERVAEGRVGDPAALRRYAGRARRIAMASLLAAAGATAWALETRHALGWAFAVFFALGAWLDTERGALGVLVRIDGERLVVETGRWTGLAVPRARVALVGFGAPARRPRARAPETFWRGDFGAIGRSHVVVVRLSPATDGRGPKRLIVPEASVAGARAAVDALRRWRSRGEA